MTDVTHRISAVSRTVGSRTLAAGEARVVTVSRLYPDPADDVWDACTNAERIPRWFLPVTGDLRLGGHYQLVGNAGGEVQECAPPADGAAHYRITWAFGGGADSWVTVRLAAVSAEETELELEHIAKVADVPEEMWAQFGPSATGIGWDSAFLGLALHLGSAADGPTPEEGMAWMMSDQGKAFSRGSADSWAAAHVADGADSDTAAAAADTAYRAYAGEGADGMSEA